MAAYQPDQTSGNGKNSGRRKCRVFIADNAYVSTGLRSSNTLTAYHNMLSKTF